MGSMDLLDKCHREGACWRGSGGGVAGACWRACSPHGPPCRTWCTGQPRRRSRWPSPALSHTRRTVSSSPALQIESLLQLFWWSPELDRALPPPGEGLIQDRKKDPTGIRGVTTVVASDVSAPRKISPSLVVNPVTGAELGCGNVPVQERGNREGGNEVWFLAQNSRGVGRRSN